MIYPYQPTPGSGVPITAGIGANQIVAVLKGCRSVCVTNRSAAQINVRINPPNETANTPGTANDQEVLAGTSRVFSKDQDTTVINIFNSGAGIAAGQVTSGIGGTGGA